MDATIVVYFLLLACATVFTQEAETTCPELHVLNFSGDCVEPLITRNIYVFSEPDGHKADTGTVVASPPIVPKLEYNIVFVKAPESGAKPDPIVVPPPQQKTIVYVLNKKGKIKQKIIEYPAVPKHKPEVYYVNYAEGDNPELPKTGVDLQTALDAVAQLDGGVVAHHATESKPDPITPTKSPAPQVTYAPAPEVSATPAPQATYAPAPDVSATPAPASTAPPVPATEAPSATEATLPPAPAGYKYVYLSPEGVPTTKR